MFAILFQAPCVLVSYLVLGVIFFSQRTCCHTHTSDMLRPRWRAIRCMRSAIHALTTAKVSLRYMRCRQDFYMVSFRSSSASVELIVVEMREFP